MNGKDRDYEYRGSLLRLIHRGGKLKSKLLPKLLQWLFIGLILAASAAGGVYLALARQELNNL
jgi:hypothetical protein